MPIFKYDWQGYEALEERLFVFFMMRQSIKENSSIVVHSVLEHLYKAPKLHF